MESAQCSTWDIVTGIPVGEGSSDSVSLFRKLLGHKRLSDLKMAALVNKIEAKCGHILRGRNDHF